MKKNGLSVFKVSIVVLSAGFLFIFYQFSQNGRFHIYHNTADSIVLDTRTGDVYYNNNGKLTISVEGVK